MKEQDITFDIEYLNTLGRLKYATESLIHISNSNLKLMLMNVYDKRLIHKQQAFIKDAYEEIYRICIRRLELRCKIFRNKRNLS